MTTSLARVLRVLKGHSPTALVHARDAKGHEHKFEVSAEDVRGVDPGHMVIVQLSFHAVPEMGTDPVGAPALVSPPPPVSTSPAVDVTSPEPGATPTTAASLEALLGLRPGRASGR